MRFSVNRPMSFETIMRFVPVLALVSVSRLTAQAPRISVGQNVHVSAANPRAAYDEFMAHADPNNPKRLIACGMFARSGGWIGTAAHVSADGGKQWMMTKTIDNRVAVDPACAYGLSGRVYFTSIVAEESGSTTNNTWESWPESTARLRLPIFESNDGGRTWSDLSTVSWIDNENLLIDQTDGPYRGRMYLYGNVGDLTPADDKVWLLYSTDSGRTFRRSSAIPLAYPTQQWDVATVLPDGTLLLPIASQILVTEVGRKTKKLISVMTSADGGEHLSTPIPIGDSVPYCKQGDSKPFMASDHSRGVFRGRAYILWDQQFTDPGDGSRHHEHCTIMLSHSDDGGASWSTPVRVSDERSRRGATAGPDVINPAIAVNPAGVVGVVWYDHREDPNNQAKRLRFTASLDGGNSWLPSVPVSTHAFLTDERGPGTLVRGQQLGVIGYRTDHERHKTSWSIAVKPMTRTDKGIHYLNGLTTGPDGVFHAFWLDSRTGTAQIFTAPVTVSGSVAKPETVGGGLEDVTPKLELRIASTSAARHGQEEVVTMDYTVINGSSDTIRAPLKLQVTLLDSDIGRPQLLLDGGRRLGVRGSVIDLTSALQGGKLGPGQSLPAQTLRIRIGGIDPRWPTRPESADVRIDVRVFARIPRTDRAR
jgi:hypothetical protein